MFNDRESVNRFNHIHRWNAGQKLDTRYLAAIKDMRKHSRDAGQ